jgi:hypothetical protein
MILASLVGCLTHRELPPDAACTEAGVAIARRTFECTGDDALANDRYEAYIEAVDCKEIDYLDFLESEELYEFEHDTPADLFHCAFAIGELACELVDAYGEDFESWLSASPMCDVVVEVR